jgi:hypothetical protein
MVDRDDPGGPFPGITSITIDQHFPAGHLSLYERPFTVSAIDYWETRFMNGDIG